MYQLEMPCSSTQLCADPHASSSDPGSIEQVVGIAISLKVTLDLTKVVIDGKLAKPILDQVLFLLVQDSNLVSVDLFCELVHLSQLSTKGMIHIRIVGEHVDTAASGHDRGVDRYRRRGCL